MSKVFDFDSSHDTVKRTMTVPIDPFTVVVDWENTTIKTFKGDKVVQLLSFEHGDFTLENLEQTLKTVEESANDLREFKDV